MRTALAQLGQYCKEWIWALGVTVSTPVLLAAIVGKRGLIALHALGRRRRRP